MTYRALNADSALGAERVIAMTAPCFNRPERFASSRVIGIEALDVLP